jgi:hypothetical protein
MPAVALGKDTCRYAGTQAGVVDITLRMNAATP